MSDIFDLINEDELTADLRLVSDICGIETARSLLRHANCINFYIPKVSKLHKFVKRYIKMNPTKSVKLIAADLGVSEYFIREMARE